MKKNLLFFLIFLCITVFSVSQTHAFKFGVFSDPHLYDTKLGTSKALDDYYRQKQEGAA